MFNLLRKKSEMVAEADALPGRDTPIALEGDHHVLGTPLSSDVPDGMEAAMFGMGCFWGVERMFWQLPGVHMTLVGYAGGHTPNPTYEEVCSGRTGHNEVVRVIYDPSVTSYETLLKTFWEGHDPTQGMRQGNDAGTQYRSGIYAYGDAQAEAARATEAAMAPAPARRGLRRHNHGDRPRADVLRRRRVPPAVPVEEPPRLLRDRGDGGDVPGGGWGLSPCLRFPR